MERRNTETVTARNNNITAATEDSFLPVFRKSSTSAAPKSVIQEYTFCRTRFRIQNSENSGHS